MAKVYSENECAVNCFLLEMSRDYKGQTATLMTSSDRIAQQQAPQPQKQFGFYAQRAFADVVPQDLTAKLFLELIYSQPLLVAVSFVPASEVIDGNAFRFESLNVLPMLKPIGPTDLISDRAAVELAKERC